MNDTESERENKSFAQAFSKACRVEGQRPSSRSAEREIFFFLPKVRKEGFGERKTERFFSPHLSIYITFF